MFAFMKRAPAIIFLMMCSFLVHSQNKLDVTFGFGFPELLHLGCRAQTSAQSQLGITYGQLADEGSLNYSVSADVYLHFGKQGKHATRKLWYYRAGINMNSESEKVNQDVYWYFDNRMGKDFYFSRRLGATVDLGLAILLTHNVKNEQPTGGFFSGGEFELPLLPAFTTNLFYRF